MRKSNVLQFLFCLAAALVLALLGPFLLSDRPSSEAGDGAGAFRGRTMAEESESETTTYGWRDVTAAEYPGYLDRLRSAGCPEERVRLIVSRDLDEFFARRLKEIAITHDSEYWKVNPRVTSIELLREIGLKVDEDRGRWLSRLLGSASELSSERAVLWSEVELTGPELGGVSREVHHRVQEICGRAFERHQDYVGRQLDAHAPLNEVELARMRERTRGELRAVLEPDQYNAFLVRHSHNADGLRIELAPFRPTREEFESIFFELDAIDLSLQLTHGTPDSLSDKQRERWERQRRSVIERVLGRERVAGRGYTAARS